MALRSLLEQRPAIRELIPASLVKGVESLFEAEMSLGFEHSAQPGRLLGSSVAVGAASKLALALRRELFDSAQGRRNCGFDPRDKLVDLRFHVEGLLVRL